MLANPIRLYKSSLSGLSRDIWTLSIIMLINRSGMMVLPFMSIYLRDQLGFTLTQAGTVLSVFGLGALSGTFLGGKLSDRFGYYPIMVGTLFFQGIMFLILVQAQTFLSVCLIVFFTSAIGEAFRPANFVAIAAYSSQENRTRALGLQRLAINLGMAIGPAIGGMIATNGGYKWLFVIDALTCMAAATLLWLTLKPKAHQSKTPGQLKQGVSPYRDLRYLLFLTLVLFNAIAFFQLFTTLPVFLKEHIGLQESSIGQLMAYSCILIVIFEMPLIYGLEKRWPKWSVTAVGALMLGFSFVLFNIFGWFFIVAVIMMTVLTFGEILTLPFLSSLAMERSEVGNRGDYMGLYTMVYSLAHILAPTVGMQIADNWGFATLWYFIGGLTVLTFAGLIMMWKSRA